MSYEESGEFLRHTSCERCGSSDAKALYKQSDDSITAYCWSCQWYFPSDKLQEETEETVESLEEFDLSEEEQDDLDYVSGLPICGWKERRITKATCEKYGVHTLGTGVDPEKRFYPVTVDDDLKGYKIRIVEGKQFGKIGYAKADSDMFGQRVFPKGGKFLCIAEGEESAMALYEALSGKYQTPCISPTAGTGSVAKQIKRNYEYIISFEKVIFFLDNDDPGRKATEQACKLLPPGKAYVADMKLKDPDEYTSRGKHRELQKLFWDAKRYSPVDVSSLGQLWNEFEASSSDDIIPLPDAFSQLAEMLGGGPAAGEVTVIGALTSIGKSTILNNIVYHMVMNTDKKVGLMYLESSPKEIVNSFLSIHTKDNLALKKQDDLNMKVLKEKFDEMVGEDNRIVNVNHNGSFLSVKEMFEKIRWLIKVAGCQVLLIDPLQAAVPSNENGVIDSFVDSLLKLAKETNASIIVVSHMRKPSDDESPHAVSEYSLKGSSSINQIAFNTFLLSRDKLHPNPVIRNTTKITLVKCRRTGNTGHAGWIKYNPNSTILEPVGDPYEQVDMDELADDTEFEGAPEPELEEQETY